MLGAENLCERAENFFREKKFTEAVTGLKTALLTYPDYPFYQNAAGLLAEIMKSGHVSYRRQIKIALLSNADNTRLVSVLQAVCFRDGVKAEIYQSGNYRAEILNPASELYRFAPEIAVIFPNYEELSLDTDNYLELLAKITAEIKNLWSVLKERQPCHIIQAGYNHPPFGAWGLLEDAIPGGRNRFLTKINLKISENLPIGLSFLDTGKLERELGEKFFSLPEWHRAFQYPALDALPLFAEHIAAHVRAVLGLAAKILVVDLDNTLWGGVTGEEGPEKILVGNGSALGQGYAALQKYLRELDDKGILLAVCSKNNLADAKEPFQKNKSMLLKLEDFIIFTANWQDKATNIKKMSQDLSLGLESFVFLDDNPVEREWVQTNLPEVIVPDCGSSPYTMLAALRRGLYFESIRVTTEDRSRYEDYKQNLNRRQFEAAAQEKNISKEEFLQTLRMEASCGNVDEKTLPRVTQLINKTNQFNLTSRRYSEEQVKKIAQAPDKWLKWYRLQDRFGDQGIVGIIIASKKETSWHIDTFLISCRVLGRQVENFMFADLAAAAKAANASSISAEYIPTPKNTLVKDLYPNWGFTYNPNTASYLFDLSLQKLPSCKISKKNTE